MRGFAWIIVLACAYLALFIAIWASECRAAWKRIHTQRRETYLIWQRARIRSALEELRTPKP